MDPYLTYWRKAFTEFEISDGKFSIPGFPEKCMGRDFNQPIDGIYIRSFSRRDISSEPLSVTVTNSEFWSFMSDNYPEAVPFLRRLLPFLIERNISHYHYFMKIDGKLVASQMVGETGDISFFFNGVVHQDYRRVGLLKELIHFVKHRMNTSHAFFWTTHKWLMQSEL